MEDLAKERVPFITVERGDDHAILRLSGEFDTCSCSLFWEEFESVRASGIDCVVLDLWMVRLMTSTALGAVVDGSKAVAADGGELVISHPSDFCRRIIENVGLERLVSVFDTNEAAVAHLHSRH